MNIFSSFRHCKVKDAYIDEQEENDIEPVVHSVVRQLIRDVMIQEKESLRASLRRKRQRLGNL